METGSKRALFPHLDACRSRYREAELKSAVSWLHLPASAAHRLNGLADCIDHELGLLLVDVVAAVRVGWDVILSTRLGGSTSRYPAKPARFSVSCGPGSHSERELVCWIVRVMAKVDCPQPQIAILTVSDRIACTRHGHHDRAVLDGDPQLANEVVLLGPPYARREVS
jgi:hypothetical protein